MYTAGMTVLASGVCRRRGESGITLWAQTGFPIAGRSPKESTLPRIVTVLREEAGRQKAA